MAATVPESIVGFLLVFVLPGFATYAGLFPERLARGRDPLARGVEIAAASLVTSVSLTIVVGFGLLSLAPDGFQAAWGNPQLEEVLGAISVSGFAVAAVRWRSSRRAPTAVEEEPEDDPFQALVELDRLHREERRLRHRARTLGSDAPERADVDAQLAEVQRTIDQRIRDREAALAR